MQTLWDVMDHYNKGDGITDPWLGSFGTVNLRRRHTCY
jgi:hypothetical protein